MATSRRRTVPAYVEDCICYADGNVGDSERRVRHRSRKMATLRKYRPMGLCDSPAEGSYQYEILETVRFRRDVKGLKKRDADLCLLENAIYMLAKGANIKSVYRSHRFGGHMSGWREYRMESGLSLVYSVEGGVLTLLAVREHKMDDDGLGA